MKKVISIVLSVVLIMTCLCACSSNDNKQQESTEKSAEDRVKFNFDSAYSGTDESAVKAYEELCKAVLNYGTEIRMNTALFDSALQLFYTSFPLSALVNDININDDNSGVIITYKLEEAEHNKQMNEFLNYTESVIKQCSEGNNNKGVFAIKLYNAIASSVTVSEDETISCFDTVIKKTGSSFSYSQLFEYLLRQKDIPTYHVIANDAAGSGWGIAGAELYGSLFYFDIMSEFYDNGGTKLKFFGMTSQDLRDEGLVNHVFTTKADAEDASDLKFDICRKCDSWSLEGANLLVTTKADEVVEVAL